jgi:signal transduction histidine kinase
MTATMNEVEHRLRGLALSSRELFWQRQATVAGATVLAAYYASFSVAMLCYAVCQFAEFLDERLIRKVLKWDGRELSVGTALLDRMTVTTALSSFAIVLYVVVIAMAEGPSLHLGPLFFLFAAALYATMNNCQVPRLMTTRLAVYCLGFLFIPVYDLWVVRPPLESELWKQLGVVVFVVFLLVECSRKFRENHEIRLAQIGDLRIERDRVARAYETQSRFVSVVSHELRTPLTSIKASLDLITGGQLAELPEEIRTVAEIGRNSSNRLAVLIDDLLDFQKLRSGNLSYRFAPVDLGQLTREVAAANQALGDPRNVSVTLSTPPQPVLVRGDADRLIQVLGNVLSNAIKFSHRDGVVEIWIETDAREARVLVRDAGIGIPDDARGLVFEPFKQVDCSDRRQFGGTGLGMSIARQIAGDHGGAIDYVSRHGVGTTFTVTLPLLSPAADETPASRDEAPVGAAPAGRRPVLTPAPAG